MTTNPFTNRASSLAGPARDIAPVTPSDSSDLTAVAIGLYVETGGTLVLTTVQDEVRTVKVSDYSILPVGVRRIHATGTTASGIHAMLLV